MNENRPSAFLLSLSGGGLLSRPQQAEQILSCNAQTAAYGLSLTPAQALALAKAREETLVKTGRVELDGGILPSLIRAFCDSLYLTQDNYADTLEELVALFYAFKNETEDRL
ncbi:MAG TPA: hypothetical protein DDY90_05620, partial [Clostridiales bacterium]|nr:hypothetical protein [Clostridiales bacterium]